MAMVLRRGRPLGRPARHALKAVPYGPLVVVAIASLAFIVVARSSAPAALQTAPIFRFNTDDFWLNLHHFLYVLGRAEAKMPNASRAAVAGAPADSEQGLAALTADERKAWHDAIAFYAAGPSRKDAVFDESLSAGAAALVSAHDDGSLEGSALDPNLRSALERAAPLYRKGWWQQHHAANIARRREIEALVDRHGAAVLGFITQKYGMAWPEAGHPVHFSGWANWAGAYSTFRGLLVMSSLDRASRGFDGVEIAFHEGMHQWDMAMNGLLFAEARRTGKRLPPNVSHGIIFMTAGEAVRRVDPDHVPYADANGVWNLGYDRVKPPLDDAWRPYLHGAGTRDEAIAALIAKF